MKFFFTVGGDGLFYLNNKLLFIAEVRTNNFERNQIWRPLLYELYKDSFIIRNTDSNLVSSESIRGVSSRHY